MRSVRVRRFTDNRMFRERFRDRFHEFPQFRTASSDLESGISFTPTASRNGSTFRAVLSWLHFGAHEAEHFRFTDIAPYGVSPICGGPQHRSQVVSDTFGNDDVIPVQLGRPVR